MNTKYDFFFSKARRSLEGAILLRDHGDHDFAASRAYYAMFYMAEAMLWSLGQTYQSHSQTIGSYGKEFAKTSKLDPKFHRWLIDAEYLRKVGDYETQTVIKSEQSEELCLQAKEFIDVVEKYLSAS